MRWRTGIEIEAADAGRRGRLNRARRRSAPARIDAGSTPSLRASPVPRSLTIGTSSSSASSQVANAASPKSRRSQISAGADERERHVDGRPVPAAG